MQRYLTLIKALELITNLILTFWVDFSCQIWLLRNLFKKFSLKSKCLLLTVSRNSRIHLFKFFHHFGIILKINATTKKFGRIEVTHFISVKLNVSQSFKTSYFRKIVITALVGVFKDSLFLFLYS